MELKEQLTTVHQALECIDSKDWMRARTVPWNRILTMLDAITNPRKMVGRVLAIYYYNKFALGRDYVETRYDRPTVNAFMWTWLRGYFSEYVRDQLCTLRPVDIYPYVDDDQVLTMIRERNEGGSDGNMSLGFFAESRKLGESLILSKDQLDKKIQDLKAEFPERFKDVSDKDIKDSLKGITIDYLDGCTDLEFDDDKIVDITGNVGNVTETPEYKALMSKFFEEIIDEWLEDHNLTHKDICWLEFDPDTNQIFLEFDANEINFEDYDDIESYREPDELDKEADEELEESFTREALTEMEKAWYTILKASQIYPRDLFLEIDKENENRIQLTALIDGDWRADHIRFKKVIEETANKIGWKILNSSEQVVRQTDEDDYPAYHYYVFDVSNPVTEDFVNEDALEETYSDEELDAMVGKTFNQQKILNIYRRQKYNDSRLFAHTRCTNCGREKRVFLSNLINDPDKYGSCVCSNTNVESRLDNIHDLYDGSKKLVNNTSGYTGVSYVKTYKGELYDKWRAYIEVDGVRTYLGDFDSKSAAIRARKKAAEKGIKWYKEHRNEFMKNYRKKSKKYRSTRKSKRAYNI